MKTVKVTFNVPDSVPITSRYPFSKTIKTKPYFKRTVQTLHNSALRAQRIAKEHVSEVYNDLDNATTQIYDHILFRYKKGTLQAAQKELQGIMNKYNSIISPNYKKVLSSKLAELIRLEKEDKELEKEAELAK